MSLVAASTILAIAPAAYADISGVGIPPAVAAAPAVDQTVQAVQQAVPAATAAVADAATAPVAPAVAAAPAPVAKAVAAVAPAAAAAVTAVAHTDDPAPARQQATSATPARVVTTRSVPRTPPSAAPVHLRRAHLHQKAKPRRIAARAARTPAAAPRRAQARRHTISATPTTRTPQRSAAGVAPHAPSPPVSSATGAAASAAAPAGSTPVGAPTATVELAPPVNAVVTAEGPVTAHPHASAVVLERPD